MDDSTALTVLQLQLMDIKEDLEGRKGKEAEAYVNDAHHALAIYEADLLRAQSILTDRSMCRSLSEAIESDADTIDALKAVEYSAIRDRQLAHSFEGCEDSEESEPLISLYMTTDEHYIKESSVYKESMHEFNEPKEKKLNTAAASSSSSKTLKQDSTEQFLRIQCIACNDEKHTFDILEVPCEHSYCRDCISELFEVAMTDESLFPPRCCRLEIPFPAARDLLDIELCNRFEQKSLELSTKDRTYCYDSTCATFIPPNSIKSHIGTCLACQQKTCTLCKSCQHKDDCANDPAMKLLLALAEESGYQRCYSCKRMIELNVGCNHITYVGRHFHL